MQQKIWNYCRCFRSEGKFHFEVGHIDLDGNIDVGDGYWRQNVLLTTERC